MLEIGLVVSLRVVQKFSQQNNADRESRQTQLEVLLVAQISRHCTSSGMLILDTNEERPGVYL